VAEAPPTLGRRCGMAVPSVTLCLIAKTSEVVIPF
jgi:hypothetical protein